MSLQGIGTNNLNAWQPQQKNEANIQADNEDNIWAKYNDKDNIVDMSDVTYIANNNELKSSSEIKAFLEAHKGETWTTSLKNELNALINRFNLECDGDSLMNDLDDLNGSFNKFKKQIKEDFKSFVEDENGKMIDFAAKNRQDKDEFVRESVNKVLDDLKNGYEGYVALSGLGVINFNSEANCFVLKRSNGQTAKLDNEKLAKLINIAIEHSLGIQGLSKKIATE